MREHPNSLKTAAIKQIINPLCSKEKKNTSLHTIVFSRKERYKVPQNYFSFPELVYDKRNFTRR